MRSAALIGGSSSQLISRIGPRIVAIGHSRRAESASDRRALSSTVSYRAITR
jgi:hypothetical protein